jgi:type IV secretory pathway VirB2 component (pilin)
MKRFAQLQEAGNNLSLRLSLRLAALTALILGSMQSASAATGATAAPGTIDASVSNIMDFLTGPTMITVVTIAVALAGLSIIFSERMGDNAGKFGKIVLGGALLLSAPQIMAMLGFTAATL